MVQTSPRRMLALVALAEFLGMTLWFSATAAAPRISAEFALTAGRRAWLTMAVQGGFVIGTLISAALNMADVFNARRLFAVGCAPVPRPSPPSRSRPMQARSSRCVLSPARRSPWVYPPG